MPVCRDSQRMSHGGAEESRGFTIGKSRVCSHFVPANRSSSECLFVAKTK